MPQHQPVVTALLAGDDDVPSSLEPLGDMASLRVARSAADLERALPETDVLAVWDFRTNLLRNGGWPHAHRIRWIHACSAGVDAVLFPELVASDVIVTNSRGVFDQATAEYVLGVLLTFAKDLHTSRDLQRERTWQHRETQMLHGRRLVVVGAGGIGRQIGRLAVCVGMRAEAVASTARDDDPTFGRVYGHHELTSALAGADAVALAVPLTSATRGMFDADAFAAMKPGAWLINVARGPVVDEQALLASLRSRRLGAAALDVFHTEPLPADHPFWTQPNVVVSPHMSGDFVGWRDALAEVFLDNFRRWLDGRPLRNVVDKQRGYVPATG